LPARYGIFIDENEDGVYEKVRLDADAQEVHPVYLENGVYKVDLESDLVIDSCISAQSIQPATMTSD
jgi:outer membrane protein assembly factor BamA